MSASLLKSIGTNNRLSGYWHTDFARCIASLLHMLETNTIEKGVKLKPDTLYSKKWKPL